MKLQDIRDAVGTDGFAAIDLVFADFIFRRCGGAAPVELFAAAALAARAVRCGDSCVDLNVTAGTFFPEDEAENALQLPPLEEMLDGLTAPECTGVLARWSGEGAIPATPLVLDTGNRLYLQRYLCFEKTVADELLARSGGELDVPFLLDGRLANLLDFFAKRAGGKNPDWQQLAAFAALSSRFLVISGGPGTGKTTVVAALLALELERNHELRVMLCAPTGKAQARLQESLVDGVTRLHVGEKLKGKLAALPCSTIHAMLKPSGNGNDFHFRRGNPLPCDLLIVDECSMVSLPLMARLLSALKPDARVILLGDKDQLASVEAGAVMADICESGTANAFTRPVADAFLAQTGWKIACSPNKLPLDGSIAELLDNHRFAAAPSIGEISELIRRVTLPDCCALGAKIADWRADDFVVSNPDSEAFSTELNRLLHRKIEGEYAFADLPHLAKIGGRENLETAFALLHRFKILAAAHGGRRGVAALNELVREKLKLTERYAPGVPLMVAENDWRNRLFNGDIGLVWRMSSEEKPRVWFPGRDRGFLPTELPRHDTVFAMTVHKSQGSGFTNVLFVMPDKATPILTRELFYTAITRAERYIELWGARDIIVSALELKTFRASGLAARLRRA